MDDFGNSYKDEEWWLSCTAYGFSMATFGMFDDECVSMCIVYSIDYAAQEI